MRQRFLLFGCLFLFVFNDLVSQDSIRFQAHVPVLNGHKFINNGIVLNPFNKTSFQVEMGAGTSSKINLPEITIGDSTLNLLSGSLLYAHLAIQFELKLKKGVSYYLKAGGSARVGVEPPSLLTNGLSTINGMVNGWKISLFNNDRHYLSTLLGVSVYKANFTNVSAFISGILQGNPNNKLSENVSVLRGLVGLHYAYGFSPTIGMQIFASYRYGDLFEPGQSGGEATFTGAFDFDLLPKVKVPVGISLGAGYTSIPEYSAAQYKRTSMYNTKIAYTGSDSFIISIDSSTYTVPYLTGLPGEESNIDTHVYDFSINMIVYFN